MLIDRSDNPVGEVFPRARGGDLFPSLRLELDIDCSSWVVGSGFVNCRKVEGI
jgi:hypothetical protein